MLIRYIDKVVPAHTVREKVGCFCDRCSDEIPPPPSSYELRDFTLEFRLSDNYPGDMYTTGGWAIEHLCDRCLDILRTFLIDNGFHLKELP